MNMFTIKYFVPRWRKKDQGSIIHNQKLSNPCSADAPKLVQFICLHQKCFSFLSFWSLLIFSFPLKPKLIIWFHMMKEQYFPRYAHTLSWFVCSLVLIGIFVMRCLEKTFKQTSHCVPLQHVWRNVAVFLLYLSLL